MPPASPTVLVVDDNEALRGIVREVLEAAGYVVLEALDGASALERAASHPGSVHLLLTDLVLPGMDGVALAKPFTAAALEHAVGAALADRPPR